MARTRGELAVAAALAVAPSSTTIPKRRREAVLHAASARPATDADNAVLAELAHARKRARASIERSDVPPARVRIGTVLLPLRFELSECDGASIGAGGGGAGGGGSDCSSGKVSTAIQHERVRAVLTRALSLPKPRAVPAAVRQRTALLMRQAARLRASLRNVEARACRSRVARFLDVTARTMRNELAATMYDIKAVFAYEAKVKAYEAMRIRSQTILGCLPKPDMDEVFKHALPLVFDV